MKETSVRLYKTTKANFLAGNITDMGKMGDGAENHELIPTPKVIPVETFRDKTT